MKLKVLSWNIWIDGSLKGWKNFLRQANADIIGLQEVKDDDSERDIIDTLTKLGYKHTFARTEQVWDGKTYRFGTAIFSKLALMSTGKVQLNTVDDQRTAAYAQINAGGTIP